MILMCARCDRLARHRLHAGRSSVELCCEHADEHMHAISCTVPDQEARRGWVSWQADHAASCPAHTVKERVR